MSDSKYEITAAFPEISSYKLNLSNAPTTFNKFYASQLLQQKSKNLTVFSSRKSLTPGGVFKSEGQEQWKIASIVDQHARGHVYQYTVHWKGYGMFKGSWLAQQEVQDCTVLGN